MKKEYDFSSATQGKFYVSVEEIGLSIHLSKDIESLIDKGLESKISPLSHKEVFDGFRTKYAQKG